jgi:hypothetical protein
VGTLSLQEACRFEQKLLQIQQLILGKNLRFLLWASLRWEGTVKLGPITPFAAITECKISFGMEEEKHEA